jgi:hypothetical protein
MNGDERREAIAALTAAGHVDDRHVGWGYTTDHEVEEAIAQLGEVEVDAAMVDRLPYVAMVIGEVWQRHPVEVRQAIAGLCWLSYMHGWLHHRDGKPIA